MFFCLYSVIETNVLEQKSQSPAATWRFPAHCYRRKTNFPLSHLPSFLFFSEEAEEEGEKGKAGEGRG